MPKRQKEWLPLQDISHRYTLEELKALQSDRVYANLLYTVNVRRVTKVPEGWPVLIHLSIKRNDKSHLAHDWRDLQQIKNEVCGPECEGVELYPAESRLVDMSNQYHLWVIEDPRRWWPFGFGERLVADGADKNVKGKSRQRAWRPGSRPKDALTKKQVDSKEGRYRKEGNA